MPPMTDHQNTGGNPKILHTADSERLMAVSTSWVQAYRSSILDVIGRAI
jgi:hypothetical protein